MTPTNDYSSIFRPQTLAQLIEEMRAHIPHDPNSTDDNVLLTRHIDRYRQFREKEKS